MDIITYALCKKADREIIDMIHDMEGMTVQIVDEIPTVQEAQYNVMYLVDTNGDGKYEAYIKAKISGIDQIISLGSIIDLSDFYTKSEIDTALAGKQPLLTWDNVPTSGSSNAISSGAIYNALTPHIELTQSQYDALQNPDAGTEYFITDATSGVAVSSLESRLAALEMQETVYYVNGVQRIPLYSQNITKMVKVDDNTVDWYFLEPTSQKTYKARVTAQGEGNTRTNPLIVVTEVIEQDGDNV